MNSHFIDMDLVLKMDSKPWIVSKLNPNVPIIKIEPHLFNIFRSGIYRSQNNRISFNGQVFWLSNDFMNKLKVKTNKNGIDISQLAISMQEFLNPDIIEEEKFKLDMSIFKSIINTPDHIYMICSKNKKQYYNKQIDKLKSEMELIGLKVKEWYFISETFYNRDDDNISHTKIKLVLQHLIGLKTDKGRFTDNEIDSYEKVTLHDDSMKTFELGKNINEVLSNLLISTDESVKSLIKETLKKKENLLISRFYTDNMSNKYEESMTPLVFSNIIRSFEGFKYSVNESVENKIDTIKQYLTFLTDKWDDMVELKNINYKKSKEIGYIFLDEEFFIEWSKSNLSRNGKLLHNSDIRLFLKKVRIEDVFFCIFIDLTGPNDFFTTLSEFYNDCLVFVEQCNEICETELITGYANTYSLSSSKFLIVFYKN